MNGVKGFQDIFSAIVKLAIAKQKTIATISEIARVIVANAVADEGQAEAIEFPSPATSTAADTDLPGLVYFCVGIGFVLALIPTPSAENAEPVGERLLEVDSETIFHGGRERVRGDFRPRGHRICEPGVNGLAVIPHVGVIDEAQQADDADVLFGKDVTADLEFEIFRASAAHVRIQMNAVGNLGHQALGKAKHIVAVVIFENCAEGKPRVSAA